MTQLFQFHRAMRTVAVAHSEAFQLMLYRDDRGNGPDRWIWNSRDGVTPFGLGEKGFEYRHAMNQYLPGHSAILPDDATHVFVDYDRAAWAKMVEQRYERILAGAAGPYHDPEDFRRRYPNVEAFGVIVPFEHGQPRLLSRAEFIAETASWAGRAFSDD